MDIAAIGSIILCIVIAALPLQKMVQWASIQADEIKSELDTPKSQVQFSKRPLNYLLSQGLIFIKGALPVWLLADQAELIIGLAITATLLSHRWSFFYKFQNKQSLLIPYWGAATALYPSAALIVPLSVLAFMLLFDSIPIAVLSSSIALLLASQFLAEDPTLILPLLFLILSTLFAYLSEILKSLEGQKTTLTDLYQNRI